MLLAQDRQAVSEGISLRPNDVARHDSPGALRITAASIASWYSAPATGDSQPNAARPMAILSIAIPARDALDRNGASPFGR